MKAFVTALLIIGLIGAGNLALASDHGLTYDTVSKKSAETQAPMEIQAFEGTINKTDHGYTLESGEETYVLKGEKLEDLVGKKVSIDGKMLKNEGEKIILVAKAELME